MIDHGEKNFVSLTNGMNASVEYRVEATSKDAAEKLLEDYKGVPEKTEGLFELCIIRYGNAGSPTEWKYPIELCHMMEWISKEMKGYCWTELGMAYISQWALVTMLLKVNPSVSNTKNYKYSI